MRVQVIVPPKEGNSGSGQTNVLTAEANVCVDDGSAMANDPR
jgi:hypothetical protein